MRGLPSLTDSDIPSPELGNTTPSSWGRTVVRQRNQLHRLALRLLQEQYPDQSREQLRTILEREAMKEA